MAEVTKGGAGFYVNLTEFHDLAINFRAIEPLLYRCLTSSLRASGQLVADDAKERASYSKSIPDSIKVRVQGLTVTVQADRTDISSLEEFAPGHWDHPVFGSGSVTQIAHPFLYPALAAKGEQAATQIELAVEAALTGAMEV